jgi:CheY-like chemotaxis protein
MKASSRTKPLKIALVEDDADLAESIRLILENSDQDIHFLGVAPTAEQALADFPRLIPDLVLMDLKLPGMQGTE